MSSGYFCIGRHMCHICVYLMLLVFICTVFWRLIYFYQSLYTSFRNTRVPVNFLIQSVRFRKICNEMILRSTSEARIWFPTLTLSMFIIRVKWIEVWFIMSLILFMFLKAVSSCVWTSSVTAPWLSKNFSLNMSYRIVQIKIINLKVRYR